MKRYINDVLTKILTLTLLLLAGANVALGQTTQPVEITTADDIINGTKKLYLIQTNQFESFYMIPQNDNVTTANLPNDQMLWYFEDAGKVNEGENEIQYYYIVSNRNSKKYICHGGGTSDSNRGVTLVEKNSSNEERCKFKLVEDNSNGTEDYYNIDAKGNLKFYALNKRSGSVSSQYPIRLTNDQYVNDYSSKWKFIRFNGSFIWPAPPFTLSTDVDKHFRKIKNKINGSYYISADASTTPNNVTIASTESYNMVWYFKEVPADPTDQSTTWFKYYYIVNPEAGDQYMYYKGTATNGSDQTNAVVLKEKNSEDEDRYQFIVVRAAMVKKENGKDVPDECYTIIPKLLRERLWDSNSVGPNTVDDGNTMGIIKGRVSSSEVSNNSHWVFGTNDVAYEYQCVQPVISYSNATGKVTITSATDDAVIHYTVDGTTTPSANVGTTYGEPFALNATTTIKAIATKDGMRNSEVTTITVSKVETPEIINDGTNIVISCSTNGATIHYSSTGEPDSNSPIYTPGVTQLSASDYIGQTINAIAIKDECINSDVKSLAVAGTCALPEISLNYQTGAITITTATNGATIRYTLDGTEPNGNSTLYEESFTITAAKTIKAVAIKSGLENSVVATESYSQVETPSIQKSGSHNISISCDTDGATIHYTDDNSVPTVSSATYSVAFGEPFSNKPIKAIALKAGMVPSSVAEETIMLPCDKPVITKNGNKFFISCGFPTSGVSIYYTINGSNPTTGSTLYNTDGVEFSDFGFVVKAIAVADNFENSEIASKTIAEDLDGAGTSISPYLIHDGEYDMFIAKVSEEPEAYYKIVEDISAGSAITTPFGGVLEGQAKTDGSYPIISGLSHALFDEINGGTVKNLMFDNVNITTGTNVGAICNEAYGTTKIAKIYNCGVLSGSVIGTGNVGGLVGLIREGSKVRVINCYNYAKVSGGSNLAGIVGYNSGTIGDVRIALCMMYGELPSGTSPVYAGNHTDNVQQFTEYNYWLYSKRVYNQTKDKYEVVPLIPQKFSYTDYNDQIAISDEWYLTRFPFHRHILNTHRELAAYFLFANNTTTGSVGDITAAQVAEIGHWVRKKDDAAHPYPIVEVWGTNTKKTPYKTTTESNYTPPSTTNDYEGKLLTSMGDATEKGYLKVTVKMSSDHTVYLPITDMDTLRYDYSYGKVILPFANEYEVNTDYTRICTGWKVVVSGGTKSFEHYNFADRDCTEKDNFNASTNPYIFAQGGYYVVPNGVSSIEITPNYATAYYVSDASYDIGLNTSYAGKTALGGSVPSGENAFHGQTVYTSLSSALDKMSNSTNPHSQAIVLVGNYHYNDGSLATGKAFTLMSIDEDNNQEPDYGFYCYNSTNRPSAPAMRFDFLPVIPVGMAAHVAGSTGFPGVPIWKVNGWFEITETCVYYTSQCEIASGNFSNGDDGYGNNRWIVNSGYFEQIIRSRETSCSKLSYIQMGGNVYVKEFYPGAHSDNSKLVTTIVPVNVTGGEIEECFMTGYNAKCSASGSDIYFWCSGGKIRKFLGANMEKVTNSTTTNGGKVNLTANVDHALIRRFFGGGTSADASIDGAINVTIKNSKVDFYCGGPEFSSASAKPTVTTTANNTEFGNYYGAGYGGTSITYLRIKQDNPVDITSDKEFPIAFSNYKRLLNPDANSGLSTGIGTCYKFEYLYNSYERKAVARFYTGYAQFSLATTGNVSNTLTECTIKNDFYGAGCMGMVDGTVTSSLTDCIVDGSAFGGGYKSQSNEVDVYTTTKPTYSTYKREMTLFTEFGEFPQPETYTWVQGTSTNKNTVVSGQKQIYTDVTMSDLGNVTGIISLTINGTESKGSTIGSLVAGVLPESAGYVFGGGNESKSKNNTTVTLKGKTTVNRDVFGGGNKAEVEGTATVKIEQ